MLGFGTGQGSAESITPLAIARGGGDTFLLAMSQSARDLQRAVYIRPLGEMNGHWNPYCAYNHERLVARRRSLDGRVPQGVCADLPDHARRPGGERAPASAEAAAGRATIPANPLVQVVWNPQGYGSPDLPGNSRAGVLPGRHVRRRGRRRPLRHRRQGRVGGRRRLYRAHPSKPFSFPEWGLWGIDDPSFVQQMATFVKTHRRTKLIAYFNAKPGSIFDLASKPRSLAAYKRSSCRSGSADDA